MVLFIFKVDGTVIVHSDFNFSTQFTCIPLFSMDQKFPSDVIYKNCWTICDCEYQQFTNLCFFDLYNETSHVSNK